jgi:hypothetical protein
MPEIVADPFSPSCYHLFPGPRIQKSQRLGPDLFFLARETRAGSRSKRGGRANSTAARDNLYLNIAADSLQVQQTVLDYSI